MSGYIYQTLVLGETFATAFCVDNRVWQDNRKQQYIEGVALLGILVVIAFLVHIQLGNESHKVVPPLVPFLLANGAVGFVVGFYVPTWYRKVVQEREVRKGEPEQRWWEGQREPEEELFCVANAEGYLQRLNPAWEKLLGYTSEELKAVPYIGFIHPDDVEETLAAAHQLNESDVMRFCNRYRHKDGSYRWLYWSASRYRDGATYAVARIVTDRLELEKLRRLARQRLDKQKRTNIIVSGPHVSPDGPVSPELML